MARVYNTTKKYWLQLKDNWFDEDAIQWLEEQPNGEKYSLFYLKLMLKSIKTDGYLIRRVGEILVPYEVKSLADLTRTDPDTVLVAMKLLERIGLVKILEDGAIFIEQVQQMIRITTVGAEQKKLQRQNEQKLIGGQMGGQMSTTIKDKDTTIITNTIKDKEKECIDVGTSTPSPEIKHIYGEFKHVRLTDTEYGKLVEMAGTDKTEKAITFLDEYIEMKGYKCKSHYLAIRKWVFDAVNEHSNKKSTGGDMWANMGKVFDE